MKAWRVVEVQPHDFCTSSLDGVKSSPSYSTHFTPGERTRIDLDMVKSLFPACAKDQPWSLHSLHNLCVILIVQCA